MENFTSQEQNNMSFDHYQEKDPAIVAYTRRLFTLDDADIVDYLCAECSSCLSLLGSEPLTEHQAQLFRGRANWSYWLLSVSERGLPELRAYMARVIVEHHAGSAESVPASLQSV